MTKGEEKQQKDFYAPKDCWTKGWGFEAKMMLEVICILAIGILGSMWMMGPQAFWNELMRSKYPTLGQFLILFGALFVSLILTRRGSIYIWKRRNL